MLMVVDTSEHQLWQSRNVEIYNAQLFNLEGTRNINFINKSSREALQCKEPASEILLPK